MAEKGYLADVLMARKFDAPDMRHKLLGRIFWGGERTHYAKIQLMALPLINEGKFVAFPYQHVTSPPFLQGDIVAPLGEYIEVETGRTKMAWQWIGYITSSQSAKGFTTYSGSIELFPVALLRNWKSEEDKIWLRINLE